MNDKALDRAARKAVKDHADHGYHVTVAALQLDTGIGRRAANKAVRAVYDDLKRQVLEQL